MSTFLIATLVTVAALVAVTLVSSGSRPQLTSGGVWGSSWKWTKDHWALVLGVAIPVMLWGLLSYSEEFPWVALIALLSALLVFHFVRKREYVSLGVTLVVLVILGHFFVQNNGIQELAKIRDKVTGAGVVSYMVTSQPGERAKRVSFPVPTSGSAMVKATPGTCFSPDMFHQVGRDVHLLSGAYEFTKTPRAHVIIWGKTPGEDCLAGMHRMIREGGFDHISPLKKS